MKREGALVEVPRRSQWATVQFLAVRMSLVETAPPASACGATTCTCAWIEMPTWPVSHMASAWTGPLIFPNVPDQVLPMRPNCQTCAGGTTPALIARLTRPADGVTKGLALV